MEDKPASLEKSETRSVVRTRRIILAVFISLWIVNLGVSFYLFERVMSYTLVVRRDPNIARPPMMLDEERTPADSAHIKRVTVLVVLNVPALALSSLETKEPVSPLLAAIILVLGASYVPAAIAAFTHISLKDRAVRKRDGWNPTIPHA